VKPVQRLNSVSTQIKPLADIFHELKFEVDALVLLPERHPNVAGLEGAVAKFPSEQDKNGEWTLGLIFELCEGGNLHKMLHQNKTALSDMLRVSMARDVAAGLAFIHSVNPPPTLHKDNPSNNKTWEISRIH